MRTSIIDDIHSKGELQWTDEFARFLDQVPYVLSYFPAASPNELST
jgi:hypothetical protein